MQENGRGGGGTVNIIIREIIELTEEQPASADISAEAGVIGPGLCSGSLQPASLWSHAKTGRRKITPFRLNVASTKSVGDGGLATRSDMMSTQRHL